MKFSVRWNMKLMSTVAKTMSFEIGLEEQKVNLKQFMSKIPKLFRDWRDRFKA